MSYKSFSKKIDIKRLIIGAVIGAVSGFLYYYFVGCKTGNCPIQSNPYYMVLYGVFFGIVLFYKNKNSNKDSQAKDNET